MREFYYAGAYSTVRDTIILFPHFAHNARSIRLEMIGRTIEKLDS